MTAGAGFVGSTRMRRNGQREMRFIEISPASGAKIAGSHDARQRHETGMIQASNEHVPSLISTRTATNRIVLEQQSYSK